MGVTSINNNKPNNNFDLIVRPNEQSVKFSGMFNNVTDLKKVIGVRIDMRDPIGIDTTKRKSFGSAFYDEKGNYIYLKEVIYNNPVVVCNWSDGSKTTAKCQSGDEYSPEVGLTICVFKRMHGNQFFQDLINNWTPTTGEKKITLKDVFKKND